MYFEVYFMSFYKTISDSVGTAAGVACPLFGIASASFSLKIGSTVALVLGSVSIVLFSAVALGVFYIFYQKNKAEELKLNNKTKAYLTEFIENFSITNRQKVILEEGVIQCSLIRFMEQNYPSFLRNYPYANQKVNSKMLEKIINHFTNSLAIKKLIPSPPISTLAPIFFLTITAVFGAVAGTTAGMMGIAVSLGLLSGFVPALGIAVILFSAVTAICIATHSVRGTIEHNQKTHLYKSFKHFNRSFKNSDLEKNKPEFAIFNSENDNKASKRLHFFEQERPVSANNVNFSSGSLKLSGSITF